MRRYVVILVLFLSLLAANCSNEEEEKGKDVLEDVVIRDAITDTFRPDASPDVIEDVSPDVVEDVSPDAVEDVSPDVLEDVIADGGTDVISDVIEDTGPQEHKYMEEEPNSDFDTANKVELNAEISGQIDEPVYDPYYDDYIPDIDMFEFEAKAGDIIRLEAKALENMDLVPVVILVDKNTFGSFLYRAAVMNIDSDMNAGMTVFIPKDGKYIAVVGEYTNFGRYPANVGGDKYQYTLTIRYSTLDVQPLDLSSLPKKVSSKMPIDMPDLFAFDVQEEKLVKAETMAMRLQNPSDIDTVVTLFNADKKEFIEMADNIDPYNDNYDSLLLSYTGGAGNFYLIVESIIYTDQKTDYDLEVDFLQPDTEVEPNDYYFTANPIRIPSETSGVIGEPKDGTDENGNPVKVGDVDNFYFYGKPGELYRFSIIAENGSPASNLDSFIAVYYVVDTILGPIPVAVNLNDNSNGKDSMVEALISTEGKYYVFVADSRNTSDNKNPVGGSDYKYKIKAEKIAINAKNVSSAPYSDSGDLEPAGGYKFYKFRGVKGEKFTIDVYQAAGSDPAFRPYVVLYDANTYKVLNSASGDENDPLKKATMSLIVPEPRDYLLAILDYDGEGGTTYKYTLDIKKESIPYYDEVEPNDDIQNANDIKGKHSLYFGTLDGDGKDEEDLVDMYKFTGSVGQVISVILYGGAEPEVGDTIVSILDSDGNELTQNDDYGDSYYSAIKQWSIPYDGTFYIKVEAQTFYGPVKGSYIMEFRLIDGCLPSDPGLQVPQSGDLVINEFYAYNVDDVNNDGVKDKGDQFIEIVNPTDKDLLLELAELKVSGTSKVKFPCGFVVPAGSALLVFGGGKPDGYFGGATLFVARNGLDLPANTDTVATISISKDSTEIAGVSYNALEQNENTSFTRDPDITGSFVKHKDAANAKGALYSPGTRTDGLPFVKGFAMFETEPNDDMANANPLPSGEPLITVFGNLKFVQGAQDNDLYDYFKIHLTSGVKISITTSAGFPPEVTDTTLVLKDSNGNELIRNEDIDFFNYYSKITDYEITADGDYYIEVDAETNYGDLPGTGYKMVIEIK